MRASTCSFACVCVHACTPVRVSTCLRTSTCVCECVCMGKLPFVCVCALAYPRDCACIPARQPRVCVCVCACVPAVSSSTGVCLCVCACATTFSQHKPKYVFKGFIRTDFFSEQMVTQHYNLFTVHLESSCCMACSIRRKKRSTLSSYMYTYRNTIT
jgi:hypothetical protein